MSDIVGETRRGYLRGLGTSYLALGVSLICQLGTIPFYVRTIGKSDFGVYVSILGVSSYAAVGIGWMSGALTKSLGESAALGQPQRFSDLIAAGRRVATLYGGILCIFALIVAGLLPNLTSLSDPFSIQVAIIFVGIQLLLQYRVAVVRQALASVGAQHRANLIQTASVLIGSAVSLVGVIATGNVASIFFGTVSGAVVATGLAKISWRGLAVVPGRPRRKVVPVLVRRMGGRSGLGYFIYGILLLGQQLEPLAISWLAGPSSAAEIALLWKPAELAVQLLWRIPEALVPEVVALRAAQEFRQLWQRLRAFNLRIFLLATSAAVGYGVLGRTVLRTWAGADNVPSNVWWYWIAAACIFFSANARLSAIVLYSTGRVFSLNLLAALEALGRGVGLFILLPVFGPVGGLVGFCAVHILGVSIGYRMSLRRAIHIPGSS